MSSKPYFEFEAGICAVTSLALSIIFALQIRADLRHPNPKSLERVVKPLHRVGLLCAVAGIVWSMDSQSANGIFPWYVVELFTDFYTCVAYYVIALESVDLTINLGRNLSEQDSKIIMHVEKHQTKLCVMSTALVCLVYAGLGSAAIVLDSSLYYGVFLVYTALSGSIYVAMLLRILTEFNRTTEMLKSITPPTTTKWNCCLDKDQLKFKLLTAIFTIICSGAFTFGLYRIVVPTRLSTIQVVSPKSLTSIRFNVYILMLFVGLGAILFLSWLPICTCVRKEAIISTANDKADQPREGKVKLQFQNA
eukprot:TRINITY_DN11429_c0_g1_i2.p1 TRINITY_DN11429_c0_g1~~TRINITY_DN11429_c0_g1_i2.p1  ORF type:complete len:315 (-),score=47.10 TRINITY_DN11429_c0_g1_i2:36-956(-)